MAHRVVGIDFGYDIIRGVEVEDPGTKRERVLRSGRVPLAPGTLSSGEVRDVPAVVAGLKQLWREAGFRTRRVVLGLGNARVLARDLDVPARPLPQIREQLPFLVADMLPMPPDTVVLDFYPITEYTDPQGQRMYSGTLVVALKEVAMTNARAARQAGLEVVGIDMIPLAIVRHLADPESEETVAFIDVGSTTSIITVATGATPVFSRIVPVGGEEVTRSLVDLGQLTREQAEQVKRTVGLSAEGVEPRYRPVVELMVTRTSELMTSIRDTIAYYNDNHADRINRIVLTGGGARLGGFAQTVAAWTRIPAALEEPEHDPDLLVATALASGSRQQRGGGRRGSRRGASGAAVTTASVPTVAADASVPVPHGGPSPEPAATAAIPIVELSEDVLAPTVHRIDDADTNPVPVVSGGQPTAVDEAPAAASAGDSAEPSPPTESTETDTLGLPGGIAPQRPEHRRRRSWWRRDREEQP